MPGAERERVALQAVWGGAHSLNIEVFCASAQDIVRLKIDKTRSKLGKKRVTWRTVVSATLSGFVVTIQEIARQVTAQAAMQIAAHKFRNMTRLKTLPTVLLIALIGLSPTARSEARELFEVRPSAENTRPYENEACCGPISAGASRVLAVLDQADVAHLWLPRQHVNWETGAPDASGPVYSSHCSAFAAAISKRLDVYMLRPPEHSPVLLASAQTAWFGRDEGRQAGWHAIATARQAQTLSNAGELVVVSYESPNPRKPGHIAIVRPSLKTAAALAEDGPEITQAGARNYAASNVRTGFKHHVDAVPNGVRYFGHAVPQALSQ